MHRHVLVAMPHPDDETFACGGTIALHTQKGTPVTVVCGTRGELGRNMGKPPFATRESLPDLREQELRMACAIMGVTDLRLLGLRDKTLEFLDPDWFAARMKAILDEVNPSLVLTYYPGHGMHPDHDAMGWATVRAVAQMAPEQRPEVHCRAFGPTVQNALGEPELVTDITPVYEIKLNAVKAHRSQSEIMLARNEERAARDPAFREQWEKDRVRETFWVYKV